MPFSRRWPVIVILSFLPLLAGCPTRPAASRSAVAGDTEDELAAVRDTLRRDKQVVDCKTAVAQLNMHLSRGGESRPAPVAATERDLMTREIRLTEDELREIGREEFGGLDAHHLEAALLFHDGIRSLRLNFADTAPAARLERARLAFAWAMRQTVLLDQPGRPLPPSYALRMGRTNADGRAGVAMEAIRQTGADVAFVGQGVEGQPLKAWAVAVLAGDEVHLFDHRAGVPIAAPGGAGIATLKQVRAAPAAAKAAIAAFDPSADPAVVVAASRVWLAPPLTALAPRMRWLQRVLSTDPPAIVGVDPLALAERFDKAGETPGWWNPSREPLGPTRSLAAFLPPEEGGTAASDGKSPRPYDVFRESLVPVDQFPRIIRQELSIGEPLSRMVTFFRMRFIELMLEPGKPRDQVLRGEFDDASGALVEAREKVAAAQQRVGTATNLEEEAVAWVREVRAAEAELILIKNGRKPGNAQAAQTNVDNLMKTAEKAILLIERAAAEPYAALATYQLALCKHEQAERQSRGPAAPADRKAAWENAVSWWDNFLARFAAAPWLPRPQIDHARALLAEAKAGTAAAR